MIKISDEKDVKVNRILIIYSKLIHGEIVNKKEMSKLFNVNEKTIQRDLEDIRNYFSDNRESLGFKDIVYRCYKKGHSIDNRDDVLTKEDILALTKILLESRAFCKEELKHSGLLLAKIWDLSELIRNGVDIFVYPVFSGLDFRVYGIWIKIIIWRNELCYLKMV